MRERKGLLRSCTDGVLPYTHCLFCRERRALLTDLSRQVYAEEEAHVKCVAIHPMTSRHGDEWQLCGKERTAEN